MENHILHLPWALFTPLANFALFLIVGSSSSMNSQRLGAPQEVMTMVIRRQFEYQRPVGIRPQPLQHKCRDRLVLI